MSGAATAPVKLVALPKVVGRGDPFHKIVELAENPVPVTVSVRAWPPAWAADGLKLLITAFATGAVIVNVELLEGDSAALTVTAAEPPAWR